MNKKLFVIGFVLTSIAFTTNSIELNQQNTRHSMYRQAIELRDFESINSFVNEGAHVDFQTNEGLTPLMIAIQENNLDSARFLLDHGADVNIHANDDTTPLIQAVSNRNFEAVKLLIDYGALVGVQTFDGLSAIKIAQTKGYWNILEYLLIKRKEQRLQIVQQMLLSYNA